MKDAKGHGSDPRGAHSDGVQSVGRYPGHTYSRTKTVHVNHISLIGHELVRTTRDRETVNYFRQQIRAGAKIPPIIVDRQGNIMDGSHRYVAFKAEGKTRVPVIVES